MELFATDLERLAFLLEADAALTLDPDALGTEAAEQSAPEELPPEKRPKYITNYIGSKQKLVDWIWKHTPEGVGTVLDAFSGSAVVAYMYKTKGLQVIANDRLRYCHHAARAIIENNSVRLSEDEIEALMADNAFTMHILSWLAVNGTAAIVEYPGVLYRGGAEKKIRQYLIDNNYIDAVIQLPPDLFFGTTIATCIIVLKKSKHDNATLFIDASSEFMRNGNKNKLTKDHQKKILDAYIGRKSIDHFARLVDNVEIAENEFNIAVSSYVAQKDEREVIDIKRLNADIARIVARQMELRMQIDAIVADLEGEEA
jgi:hypothetical protein